MDEAMSLSVATQARRQVDSTASITRRRDWIMHRAVSQPAGVAPVQPLLPRREELLKGSQGGVLILTRLLGREEVETVASFLGVVREHHA